MPFPSHHIKDIYCQHDITVDGDFDREAEAVVVRFHHCKIILSPLFSIFQSLKLLCITLKEWEFALHLLESRASVISFNVFSLSLL